MHYVLIYCLGADYLAPRRAFRDEHLALAWAAQEHGELVLAGAPDDPVDTAPLVFHGESPAAHPSPAYATRH